MQPHDLAFVLSGFLQRKRRHGPDSHRRTATHAAVTPGAQASMDAAADAPAREHAARADDAAARCLVVSAEAGGTAPLARPRELLRLADGASLNLVAAPVRRVLFGRTVTMLGFNGQYPGPLVQVDEGSTIVVRFTNRTDFPTAMHWHGVRLDNRFDGVPHVTQDPVPPGGSFEYRVHFRDAGIYWYHPHHREDVLQDLGLYGNLLVRSRDPDYFATGQPRREC